MSADPQALPPPRVRPAEEEGRRELAACARMSADPQAPPPPRIRPAEEEGRRELAADQYAAVVVEEEEELPPAQV